MTVLHVNIDITFLHDTYKSSMLKDNESNGPQNDKFGQQAKMPTTYGLPLFVEFQTAGVSIACCLHSSDNDYTFFNLMSISICAEGD